MPDKTRLAKVMPQGQQTHLSEPAYSFPAIQIDNEPVTPVVPLSHYLWILRRHLLKILAFMAACILVTFIVTSRLTPLYESTATVDIDRQTPSEVVGAESERTQAPNDADQFLATQVKMVLSDSVLRPVALQYNLLQREGQMKGKTAEQQRQIQAAPIVLKRLKVVRPPNTYMLLISYRSPDSALAADVANAIAKYVEEHEGAN